MWCFHTSLPVLCFVFGMFAYRVGAFVVHIILLDSIDPLAVSASRNFISYFVVYTFHSRPRHSLPYRCLTCLFLITVAWIVLGNSLAKILSRMCRCQNYMPQRKLWFVNNTRKTLSLRDPKWNRECFVISITHLFYCNFASHSRIFARWRTDACSNRVNDISLLSL